MSPVRLNGSTSGYSQIDAPAVAGDQVFTLPGTGGTLDRLNRAGNVLQVVSFQTGTRATGTGTIPGDNTIPQNTEGTEFMTLAITPTSSTSKMVIDVVGVFAASVANSIVVALFQDSTANALACHSFNLPGVEFEYSLMFRHYMTSGTTSATTFKVRAGLVAAGTTAINGNTTTSFYGGTQASSITITEIAA